MVVAEDIQMDLNEASSAKRPLDSAADDSARLSKRTETGEEFAVNKLPVPAQTHANTKGAAGKDQFNVDLLRVYYDRLFPYKRFFRWLSYENDPESDDPLVRKDFMSRREFSFTVDEVYMRYLSFNSVTDMMKEIQSKCPHKIDIGAVFNANPKNRTTIKASEFKPVERELVFDIDMDDYDVIRTCCTGANVCNLCWKFLTCAIKTITRVLREDFGFRHILWVYSGRRGIHCWVCDPRARKLTNDGRTAVAEYLNIFKGDNMNLSAPLHKSHDIAKKTFLEEYFVKIAVEDQHKFDNVQAMSSVLSLIPDDEIRGYVTSRWTEDLTNLDEEQRITKATQRWMELQSVIENEIKTQKKKNWALMKCINEIIFFHTYPRLDVGVSKHLNHLLKSPFCVHPKTGRVCVPIDPDTCDEFDPLTVPTVAQLHQDMDDWENTHMDTDEKVPDLHKTSLKPYIDNFDRNFLRPLQESIRAERRAAAQSDEARVNTW
eukprot:GFYU01010534.1.p1 GENE.GFYU01010534.1~~GFYU01010534.1.p1  ORF type:complete len:489 (+),score=154.31 GFYU01010534.1:59-1525(+)